MYRDLTGFPVETLNDCKTWWDVVVWRYFGELASVTFVVENQEETSGYDPELQKAWVKVALSDYKTEFQIVYDFLTFLDGQNIAVKELYNNHSYMFENSTSLVNIKEKYLSKFDLLQPNHPLITRYAKFLFDNYKERFPANSQFLQNL